MRWRSVQHLISRAFAIAPTDAYPKAQGYNKTLTMLRN